MSRGSLLSSLLTLAAGEDLAKRLEPDPMMAPAAMNAEDSFQGELGVDQALDPTIATLGGLDSDGTTNTRGGSDVDPEQVLGGADTKG